MKTCIKESFLVPVFVAVVAVLVVCRSQAQFTYATNNGTITITGYLDINGVVVIPYTITGPPVTAIGDQAFANRNLTSVTIPNSVTSIGRDAFELCSSVTNVTIGNSVAIIGRDESAEALKMNFN